MANKIQIKRSTTGGNVPTLDPGELAVNLVDKRLFTANATTVFDAVQNTASSFAITNSSGATFFIGNASVNAVINSTTLTIANVIITNSLALNADAISLGNSTVNAVANSLSLTLSNSTVTWSLTKPTAAEVTSGDYFLGANGIWQQVTGGPGGSPGGSNTYVQYNDSGSFDGTAGFTYDKDTNNVVIANTLTVNVLTILDSLIINTDAISIGNSTINAVMNSSSIVISNSSATANLSLAGGVETAGTIANSSGVYPLNNTSGTALGSTTQRWVITGNTATFSGAVTFAGGLSNSSGTYPTSNSSGTSLGTATARWNLYANAIFSSTDYTTSGNVAPYTNAQALGYTTTRWIVFANSVAVSDGVYPESNTLGYNLGSSTKLFNVYSNSLYCYTGVYPADNSSGTALGSTTKRWVLNANTGDFSGTVTTAGGTLESGGMYPTSNTSGQALGNANRIWNIYGNTIYTSAGIYPQSNSLGTGLGGASTRWVLYANTGNFSGGVYTSTGMYPVSNTEGQALGGINNRWALNANTGNFSGDVTISGAISGFPRTKSITIETPTATEKIAMFFTNTAITLTQIRSVLIGSATPSVTFSIRYGSDLSAAGTEVVTSGITCTNVTAGLVTSSFNNGTITGNTWVWLTTSAQSGTVNALHVSIF